MDYLFCIPQIKTKKVGRPASSVTKKSIGRLAKDRKGRKALGGDSTVGAVGANQDQEQDHSSDEDDNPGDMDMSSDEEEEGESEIELEPTFEMEEVGLTEQTQDLEAWKSGTTILCSDRKEGTERGISRLLGPLPHLIYHV
jgi:hypothetical protein